MHPLDIFAFIVMALLAGAAAAGVIFLGGLPGKVAAGKGHPQADAIQVCGWLGLLVTPLWPFALIWAYLKPSTISGNADGGLDRIAILERRIEQVESRIAQSGKEAADS